MITIKRKIKKIFKRRHHPPPYHRSGVETKCSVDKGGVNDITKKCTPLPIPQSTDKLTWKIQYPPPVHRQVRGGGILPRKNNFWKNFVRNFGTVFLPGLWERFFPLFSRKVQFYPVIDKKNMSQKFIRRFTPNFLFTFQNPEGAEFLPRF